MPITAIVFFGLAKSRLLKAATYWLILSSIVFYGYWSPIYVPLLLISVAGNFFFGYWLNLTESGTKLAKTLLWLGIGFNLTILGYYKYAAFIVTSTNHIFQIDLPVPDITLPLGISFYSFTQIAYLVDSYRGETKSGYSFSTYILFVVFFPQLIAGPILRYNELIPEFKKLRNFVFSHKNLAIGSAFFTLGLAKKVLIADSVSPWVNTVFSHASDLTLIEAWFGAIAYTLQLYFDFSGYSDMAIGLGLMFNIHLPINFNSPYKATSIIDFWRRWHMTLSNFLRDYLYIPLGGSRKGELRRYTNLFLTMLLGGLWHGAGWTYVIWGGLHGLFLITNHGWRKVGIKMPSFLAWFLTFNAVVFSWVIFRASSLNEALEMIRAMLGMNGISLPEKFQVLLPWLSYREVEFMGFPYLPSDYKQGLMVLILLLAVVIGLPNTQQIIQRFQPSWLWAISLGGIAALCLISLNRVSEFLYFQF
ncbi:MBOAT family O-acyltransferase [Leptothermofonsia sp. ETS-13]|uniref:MBOAT family O-acyltransferase n=1 Tax=Leptothermofonsia sp. ETS-13 TaxID=3035696 RepID=UPI003B9E4B00